MSTIRPALAADLPALKALLESAYRGDSARQGWTHEADLLEDERITAEDLAAALADPAQHTLVALDDAGAVYGTITITDKGDGLSYLGMLAVDPARQAGGLGRALITAGEDVARGFGAKRMEMTVISRRAELIAYYERRGFLCTGETRPFPYGGVTHLAMVVLEKSL